MKRKLLMFFGSKRIFTYDEDPIFWQDAKCRSNEEPNWQLCSYPHLALPNLIDSSYSLIVENENSCRWQEPCRSQANEILEILLSTSFAICCTHLLWVSWNIVKQMIIGIIEDINPTFLTHVFIIQYKKMWILILLHFLYFPFLSLSVYWSIHLSNRRDKNYLNRKNLRKIL